MCGLLMKMKVKIRMIMINKTRWRRKEVMKTVDFNEQRNEGTLSRWRKKWGKKKSGKKVKIDWKRKKIVKKNTVINVLHYTFTPHNTIWGEISKCSELTCNDLFLCLYSPVMPAPFSGPLSLTNIMRVFSSIPRDLTINKEIGGIG